MKKKLFQIDKERMNEKKLVTHSNVHDTDSTFEVAVTGISLRFPMANSVDEFWENLIAEKRVIRPFPKDRIRDAENAMAYFYAGNNRDDYDYKRMGYLEEIDKFDHKFFKLTSKEAQLMNPGQRLFLETAWHAIEDSGHNPLELKGENIGVYLGYAGSLNDYYKLVCEAEPEHTSMAFPGNIPSIMASRVSYVLDFKGPSMMLDTACSSSLVAIHTAYRAIKNGECDAAIAGGVNLTLAPMHNNDIGVGVESSQRDVASFSHDAEGTIGGEGCAALVLKPLKKALLDGDPIYAVIKGSAANQDGNSMGITAPNSNAQTDLLEKAWKDAKINPETISYIETHGTATKMGDPIEIQGITNAIKRYSDKKQFCGIGTVKSDIGHLDAAAGIAGFIKLTLSLKLAEIPGLKNFDRPSPSIDFQNSPLYVVDHLIPWQKQENTPRRGGVSSFGISGTNCHIILEEPPAVNRVKIEDSKEHVFSLSATNSDGLIDVVEKYIEELQHNNDSLGDICYTVNIGRNDFNSRLILCVSQKDELLRKLRLWLQNPSQSLLEECVFFGERTSASSAQNTSGYFKQTINEESKHTDLLLLCEAYVNGENVNWKTLYKKSNYRRVSLPGYAFERKRCWVSPIVKNEISTVESENLVEKETNNLSDMSNSQGNQYVQVINKLKQKVASLFETSPEEVDIESDFFELGLDSISIIQIQHIVKKDFKVEISIGQLINDISCIRRLAEFLQTNIEETTIPADSDVKGQVSPMNSERLNSIEKLIHQQMSMMAQQLELLKNSDVNLKVDDHDMANDHHEKNKPVVIEHERTEYKEIPAFDLKSISDFKTDNESYINSFIDSFVESTSESKKIAESSRSYFANNRNVAGYKKNLKEIKYSIVAKEANGARFVDVDGNEYLDMAMGFGVFMFGYKHPAIVQAMQSQIEDGIFLGPQSALAHEAADLFCELTGSDRVAFFNTGSEAVMVALRLARAYTSKNKIVMFSGSYHGIYDGVMAQADSSEFGKSISKSAGIPAHIFDDVVMLEYGDSTALEYIRNNGFELAGVLVEPVQSRRPDFQPVEFLQELRELTLTQNIPLIFDEVITGFRIHTGGVQAVFNIKADITIYGKLVGGGLPVGVVAGKKEFMLGIDGGGHWNFGDDSQPVIDHRKIVVAGTFCNNPMVMASVKAIMSFLKKDNGALQKSLNLKTQNLTEHLNQYFEQNGFDASITHFGSLFRIKTGFDPDLLLYHLLKSGVYMWEGMVFFLSSAHSDSDIEEFIGVIKNCFQELLVNGLIPSSTERSIDTKSAEIIQEDSFSELTSVSKKDFYPLSNAQKRLWVSHQITENESSYNMPQAYVLEGKLEVSILVRAFKELVRRHEILRTVFTLFEGEPYQKIIENDDFSFEVELIDLPEQPAADEKAKEIVEQEATSNFNIELGPLIRVRLLRFDSNKHILLFTLHHIISDAWSMDIIINEVSILYAAFLKGENPHLPDIDIQYKDYSMWQNSLLQQGFLRKKQEYWLEKFNDIPILDLPTDYARPSQKSYGSMRQDFEIDEKLTSKLKEFCKRNKLSVFTMLLTAVRILMYKYTNQKSLVIGTTVAGRDHEKLKYQLGFYINSLPLKLDIKDELLLLDALNNEKQNLGEALANQEYPFDKLVEDLGIQKDLSRSPLFDVLVEMVNVDLHLSENEQVFENIDIRSYQTTFVENKYDLSFRFNNADKITLSLEYSTDLFSNDYINRLSEHFRSVLNAFLSESKKSIGNFSLVTTKEIELITNQVNNTNRKYPEYNNIVELLYKQSDSRAESIALIFNDEQITYGELNTKTNQLATYIIENHSIVTGDKIAILSDRSADSIIAMYAILKAGGTFLFLDGQNPTSRNATIIESAEIKLLFTNTSHLMDLADLNYKGDLFALDVQLNDISCSKENLAIPNKAVDDAYVLFTSGSTGRPKGVSISHKSILNYTLWASEYYLGSADTCNFPLFTSLSFDLTLTSIFVSLAKGGSVTVYDNRDTVKNLSDIMRDQRIDSLKLTPSHVKLLDNVIQEPNSKISTVIVGGEKLTANEVTILDKLAPSALVYNEYGPTETTIGCTVKKITDSNEPISIGKPINNTHAYVLNSENQIQPIGITGELFVGGDGLANGYLNAPDITAEKFVVVELLGVKRRLYRTGDLVKLLANGDIEYIGRVDDQIKVRGFRIELGEVEDYLGAHPEIKEAAVLAIERGGGKSLVGYYSSSEKLEDSILQEHLAKNLPDYMLPNYFVWVDKMPLTINGKIDRKELPDPELSFKETYKEPSNEIEEQLQLIWAEVLQMDITVISVTKNFFLMGGNSLNATKMVNNIFKQFEVDIPLMEIFKQRTIQSLANYIMVSKQIDLDADADGDDNEEVII